MRDAIQDMLGPHFNDKFSEIIQVGEGGMGVVYRGHHRMLDAPVAIKLLKDGGSPDRFLREARILATIQSAHVVRVLDFDVSPSGIPILIMEWVEGEDMDAFLARTQQFPGEAIARSWMTDVATGMLAAEQQHVIHRDLKPANIFLRADGQAVVGDFGLAAGATVNTATQTQVGIGMGTAHYMAPEQARDASSVDIRADIYGFGATFYDVCTGRPPFTGTSDFDVLLRHLNEPLVSPAAHNPDLSESVVGILERSLAKHPSDRFQSFDDIRHVLHSEAARAWEHAMDEQLPTNVVAKYQHQRPQLLTHGLGEGVFDTFRFENGNALRIGSGDITQLEVEAVVSSDDDMLSMGGGVSHAIATAAGHEMVRQARSFSHVRPGRVVPTGAGDLRADYVFHAVTLGSGERLSRDLINDLVDSALELADTLRVRTLAFPLLGTGVGGFPEDVCLDTMVTQIGRALMRGLTDLEEATICLYSGPRT